MTANTTRIRAALLCAALLALAPRGAIANPASGSVKTVLITANDSLRFNVTRIEAQPGQKIHVQLHNAGTMPKDVMGHNWVLLRTGQDPSAYAAAAATAKNEGYEPKTLGGEVLAAIPLLGPGETGGITFEAPSVPGTYPFLCSSPAHYAAGMRGTLVVK